MKFQSFSTVAVFSSLIASLCCIGPVAAILLGAGAFGFLAALETFRPYLTLLSIGFIATAFYLAHRSRKACSDGTCAVDSRRTLRRVWIASIVTLVLLAIPYFSCTRGIPTQSKPTVIDVKGMTCAGCEKLVESVVGKLDGVSAVHASASEGKINVVIDSTKISLPSIITTLDRETPYKASIPTP